MGSHDEESNSDGLEILSIGALYSGSWDKKYWSSSRGKDRYPYPVGYQALRTHKGLTYKMEIHEGPKGPIFQIFSNDKQSGSGETPDRAWENFQKKCCSRIKIWNGKRFSGKIDGVEFFGFKNALVQRLLRELVAAVNDASEPSSPFTSFNETSAEGQVTGYPVTCKYPDLTLCFEKTRVTGKRNTTRRGIDTKLACQSNDKDAKFIYSTPRRNDKDAPIISCASYHDDDISHGGANLTELSNIDLGKNVSRSACLTQVQRELPSMETCTPASLVDAGLPQEEKPEESLNVSQFDRQCIEPQGLGFPVATEYENENVQGIRDFPGSGPPVLKDSQVNHYGDLCAPDTLDTQQEITSPLDSGSYRREDYMARNQSVVADVALSEEPITGSHSEGGSFNLNGYSEKSDFDSVSEEIAKSMMTVLLPRAVPLLTYSSRKKRRKTKPTKISPCELKLENESKGTIPSDGVMSSAGAVDNSGIERQTKSHVPSVYVNPAVSMLESPRYIVPDSLDNNQCEYHVADQIPHSSDNAEARAAGLHNGKRGPDGIGSSIAVGAIDSRYYRSQTDGFKDNSSIPLEVCSKKTELECAPDCEGKIYDEFRDVRSIPASGEQQSKPGNLPPNPSSVVVPLMTKYNAPLSESIICRNIADNCVSETYHAAENLVAPDSCQVMSSCYSDIGKSSFGVGGKLEGHMDVAEFIYDCDLHIGNSQADIHNDTIINRSCEPVYHSSDQERVSLQNYASHIKEGQADEAHNYDIQGSMKLIGCYSHPMRISSVLLTRKAHEIYICVSCGLLEERKRDLFLYKLLTEEPSLGSPYMVGHTSLNLPVLKDELGRDVAIDKSGLQFTPDAKGLVLMDSIRIPYCREKNLDCLCQKCESCCFEENAVKIVRINFGYASLVMKLNTSHPVTCVLVCEPERLIAVDESGGIYIWVMDPTWSSQTEEFVIPSYDFLPGRIVELKRIPKSTSIVVGHNGYGEFSLWDIIKRTVLSRFSAPGSSVLGFLPVSLFSWQKESLSHNKLVKEECVKKLVEATMLWFPGHSEANVACPMEEEDIAVWILICTSSDTHAQSGFNSSSYHLNPEGSWRLGLLIKNTVILGPPLHPRTAAIGTSARHGIIGTDNGRVYIWELATGAKVETLHEFPGIGVSHIATDDSTVTIARDDGRLWVYLHT